MPISLCHPQTQIRFLTQNSLGTRHLKVEKFIKVKTNLKHTFYPSSHSPDIQKTVKKVKKCVNITIWPMQNKPLNQKKYLGEIDTASFQHYESLLK